MTENIYDVLKERGYIAQCTDEEGVRRLFAAERATFYIGFDPTADSLHVGHFLALMAMSKRKDYMGKTLKGHSTLHHRIGCNNRGPSAFQYNSTTAVLASQDTGNSGNTDLRNSTGNSASSSDITENKNLTMEGSANNTEQSHIHGNIGVTTAQQMINAELDLLPRINVVNYIVE